MWIFPRKPYQNFFTQIIICKNRLWPFLPGIWQKKTAKPTKLVATPLLFSCTSHCVLNLYVNAVYNISLSLRKYFFPQNTNFVYLHKTLAQFYHFIIHIHPIPHRDVHGILKLSPLSSANLSFFIIDHSFFTIFPLTFPHKSLIMLSKLII